MTKKEIVENNFSRHANCYDDYSLMQTISSKRLISSLDGHDSRRILDLGCGTGIYTQALLEHFPKAQITAIDISPEMIKVASEKLSSKNITFIASDAETIKLDGKFDLVTSNASFQWFGDFEETISKYSSKLSPYGTFLFSIFGPDTFCELRETLYVIFGEKAIISSDEFLKSKKISKILKLYLKNVTLEEKKYKQKYSSFRSLLKNIKYSGTRGHGVGRKNLWTPKIMNDLEKIYRDKFSNETGDIEATYQIFFCKGEK